MSIKAQRIECRYLSTNRSSHQSKNARIKTITNMAQLFGNLTLVSMAMILLAVSGANGAPDPTTLEEAQGSYTNRDSEDTFPPFALSTMSDDEDMERTRRKRGMGQDSGFVRFGKRMSSEGDYIDDGMTDSRQFNEVLGHRVRLKNSFKCQSHLQCCYTLDLRRNFDVKDLSK